MDVTLMYGQVVGDHNDNYHHGQTINYLTKPYKSFTYK